MIGERLADIRKDNGDTQASLAKKLSTSLHTIRAWEQEKSSPNHEMLVAICRLYHVSSDYLLGLSDIDPAYAYRQRLERFSVNELKLLQDFEAFLLWKRKA